MSEENITERWSEIKVLIESLEQDITKNNNTEKELSSKRKTSVSRNISPMKLVIDML